jgi:hypothetical protein
MLHLGGVWCSFKITFGQVESDSAIDRVLAWHGIDWPVYVCTCCFPMAPLSICCDTPPPPLAHPPTHPQVPPSRISGLSASEVRAAVHRDAQALLGPQERLRALLNSLCVPPGAGGTLQVWLLMSVLEAADLVLWVDVSTPGGRGLLEGGACRDNLGGG